jgi:diguanylate cyclase
MLEQARAEMVSMTMDAMMQLEQTTRTVEVLERENEQLESLARTDGLTGLPNRPALDAFLSQQVHLRLRGPLPGHLGVIMIDIDHFKQLNDTYGHPAGDEVLRSVAAALRQAARESDFLARYGGEEFCLVVADATPNTLGRAGERLRAAIAAADVDLGPQGRPRVTASFGGACLANITATDDASRLIAAADQHLYQAKETGRNRVITAPKPIP